ncbi:MAG: hypothetical protein ABIO39_12185, partial [Caulobacteraceae bacterium]
MFAALPLLVLPVLFYNILVAATLDGGLQSHVADSRMGQHLFTMPMTSGGEWAVTYGDLIVFVSLVILFIELLKSTTSRR